MRFGNPNSTDGKKGSEFTRLGDRLRVLLRGQLSRNALLAGIQAIVGMVCMFWAYRVLIRETGLERMGLWSLLLAGASFFRLADVTGAGGLARFVAEAQSRNEDAGIYVHTITIATSALFALLGVVAYIFSHFLVDRFVTPEWLLEARALTPLAIISGLFFTPLASTLSSGVDGLQRADKRALLVSFSYVVFLGTVMMVVPHHGVWGWGTALVLQQLIVIIGAWRILERSIPGLGVLPHKWSNKVFRITFSFGLKLQLNAIASQLSEPLAKMMLGTIGGLSAVALYELSVRLVMSLRAVVVQMAQPLVPAFAAASSAPEKITVLLRRATRAVTFATIALGIMLLAAAPIFSLVMLGSLKSELLVMIAVLSFGYLMNTLAVPHYYLGIGCNIMRWNLMSQIAIALSIIVLGHFLTPMLGALAIVVAISFGLAAGAVLVVIGNGHTFSRITSTSKMSLPR